MNYDIAIIGAGPGGYTAAIRASQLGKKVALIEKGDVGGSCLNTGCVPTKTLFASAKLYSKMKNAEKFGIFAENLRADFPKMVERKNRILNQLRKGLEYLFKGNNIDLIRGEAKLNGPEQIVVGDQVIEAPHIILATGSTIPERSPFKIDEKRIFSSTGILNLEKLPENIAIIGAGAIGIEFTSIFNALGSKVTLFEMMPRVMIAEDAELSQALEQLLSRKGVEVKTGTSLQDAAGYEAVLVSIGRKLNTEGFEKLGIELNKGKVKVNEKMQTNIPNIYAIGDIAGKYMFAHTAAREGIVAAENICGKSARMDNAAVPKCLYAQPEVGSVGLTEEEARSIHKDIQVGKVPFSAISKSLIDDERDGFVKVIGDRSGKVLGVHIIGNNATEIIGEATLAINKGLKIEDLMSTIHAHPAVYESMGEAAANALKQAISILNK
jgi:dihydrolipoamide dehydrogenase